MSTHTAPIAQPFTTRFIPQTITQKTLRGAGITR